jgi:hypothetical protein
MSVLGVLIGHGISLTPVGGAGMMPVAINPALHPFVSTNRRQPHGGKLPTNQVKAYSGQPSISQVTVRGNEYEISFD